MYPRDKLEWIVVEDHQIQCGMVLKNLPVILN